MPILAGCYYLGILMISLLFYLVLLIPIGLIVLAVYLLGLLVMLFR
ncbi:MAG TPA: hypothetical protein P5318_07410 [Candidatus Hydrogenedentes bacterium]|nr:hypothetical protein [Candidatus Hydrogenedentota bacterium]HPC15989.1 hypothetical protein [Candidatus Hydrogenedentota bacterium]HRT19943.1 hypothetical protein [Candidatus Hydrogenedentota bacterium]HRT64621.1 hypothetical protein [Candidatus Hydrogenedentota bacterium]